MRKREPERRAGAGAFRLIRKSSKLGGGGFIPTRLSEGLERRLVNRVTVTIECLFVGANSLTVTSGLPYPEPRLAGSGTDLRFS